LTAGTRFAVYMDGEGEPTSVLEGREALMLVFADLSRYEATTQFNGQSAVTVDGTARPARASRSPVTSSRRTATA
jgi:hypothetical protein